MENQTTDTILMIEPVAFGYNAETAVNNYFQQKDSVSPTEIQAKALAEFNGMVSLLRKNGIRVITLKDTYEPHTPDSVFPNNWISFHEQDKTYLTEDVQVVERSGIEKESVNVGVKIAEQRWPQHDSGQNFTNHRGLPDFFEQPAKNPRNEKNGNYLEQKHVGRHHQLRRQSGIVNGSRPE